MICLSVRSIADSEGVIQINHLPQSVITAIESSNVPSILNIAITEDTPVNRQQQAPGGYERRQDSLIARPRSRYSNPSHPYRSTRPDPYVRSPGISRGHPTYPEDVPSYTARMETPYVRSPEINHEYPTCPKDVSSYTERVEAPYVRSPEINHEHPTCPKDAPPYTERVEAPFNTLDWPWGGIGGMNCKPQGSSQTDANPNSDSVIPSTSFTPELGPQLDSLGNLSKPQMYGFPHELIKEMITYSSGRYKCRQCESWDVPSAIVTVTELFLARVHILKRCPAASVQLRARLMELDLDIDGTSEERDISYLSYLHDYALEPSEDGVVSVTGDLVDG